MAGCFGLLDIHSLGWCFLTRQTRAMLPKDVFVRTFSSPMPSKNLIAQIFDRSLRVRSQMPNSLPLPIDITSSRQLSIYQSKLRWSSRIEIFCESEAYRNSSFARVNWQIDHVRRIATRAELSWTIPSMLNAASAVGSCALAGLAVVAGHVAMRLNLLPQRTASPPAERER